jgi:hypothetical protein
MPECRQVEAPCPGCAAGPCVSSLTTHTLTEHGAPLVLRRSIDHAIHLDGTDFRPGPII